MSFFARPVASGMMWAMPVPDAHFLSFWLVSMTLVWLRNPFSFSPAESLAIDSIYIHTIAASASIHIYTAYDMRSLVNTHHMRSIRFQGFINVLTS